MFSKSTSAAISGMIRLAYEFKKDDCKILKARDIAKDTNLQAPFIAKLLTTLSQYDMVKGNPGPNGGYILGKTPKEINLLDIAKCFERVEIPTTCLFGHGNCSDGMTCPMHEKLADLFTHRYSFLKETTLEDFLEDQRPARVFDRS